MRDRCGACRVVIVDDDERFASMLALFLESEGLTVVGAAANGAEGVAVAEELRPDVVTMDLEMPVMDGIEATRRIVPVGVPVVVLSGSASRSREAIEAGAAALVAKEQATTHLVPLLRALVTRTRRARVGR